jgi:hypothetical protein
MGISSIGVQPISRRTGGGWADGKPAKPPPSDSESDTAPPKSDRPAPAPNVGGIVDRTV